MAKDRAKSASEGAPVFINSQRVRTYDGGVRYFNIRTERFETKIMNVSPDIGYLDTSVGWHVGLTAGEPRPTPAILTPESGP